MLLFYLILVDCPKLSMKDMKHKSK